MTLSWQVITRTGLVEFDLKMKAEHEMWSTPPNDCKPYDMENEDFMQHLIHAPHRSWTKEQTDWVNWWSKSPLRKFRK